MSELPRRPLLCNVKRVIPILARPVSVDALFLHLHSRHRNTSSSQNLCLIKVSVEVEVECSTFLTCKKITARVVLNLHCKKYVYICLFCLILPGFLTDVCQEVKYMFQILRFFIYISQHWLGFT